VAFKSSGLTLDAWSAMRAVLFADCQGPQRSRAMSVDGDHHSRPFLLIQLLLRAQALQSPHRWWLILGTVTAQLQDRWPKIPLPAPIGSRCDLSGIPIGIQARSPGQRQPFNIGKATGQQVCNMITTQELTPSLAVEAAGCSFLVSGCVTDTPLFRNRYPAGPEGLPWIQMERQVAYVARRWRGACARWWRSRLRRLGATGAAWVTPSRAARTVFRSSQERASDPASPLTWSLMQLVGLD